MTQDRLNMKYSFIGLILQLLPQWAWATCAYYLPDTHSLLIPQVWVDEQAQFSATLHLQGDAFVLQHSQVETSTLDDCAAHFNSVSGELFLPQVNIIGDYFLARLQMGADVRFHLTQLEALNVPFGLPTALPTSTFNVSFSSNITTADSWQAVRAFPQLEFIQPVFMTHAPGDQRLFLVEQIGRILAFNHQDATQGIDLVLDLRDRLFAGGEEGLLGLAFDPDYLNHRYLYVYYSAANPRRSVVSRFSMLSGTPAKADPDSEKILLEVEQPFANHNAGMLVFGPDNMLYIALGDGGSGGDPLNHGQNRNTLLGSLLRIDPQGDSYAIPADNPFLNQTDVRPEIWAYGLRNPYRFSFDRATGELWAGDVGQNSFEEINVIVRGGNYGWRLWEGYQVYDNPQNLPIEGVVPPLFAYGRDEGVSVTGGYVYRGQALPALQGAYIYGDFGSGKIWALRRGAQVENTLIAEVPMPSGFGEDAQGELYIISYQGALYRLQQGAAQEPPARLSDTELFSDTATLTPAEGLLEYQVNAPLWSDATQKRRWIAVPKPIEFSADGAWTLPVGSVLVKHFEWAQTADLPPHRLETRLMLRQDTGWVAYTYKWNAAQDDAELLSGGLRDTVTLHTASREEKRSYYYPSRTECWRCHQPAAGMALAINTRQLNRNVAYAAGEDNQLRAWQNAGLFSQSIGAHEQYTALAQPSDTTAPIAERARAYLDTNCAVCHSPGGSTPVNMDLRHDIPVDDMRLLNQAPEGLHDDALFLLTPGNAQQSLLWKRMQTLSTQRMPPLGSAMVDTEGVGVIQTWIEALKDEAL